jgi:hypothetical protein
MTRSRSTWLFAVALVTAALIAPPASFAAGSGAEFGPRIGMSSTPDQLVLGGQVEFPEFAPHLTVDPNVEIGFLDHQTVVAMNADFLYHFVMTNSAWAPYAGMGLGIAVFQYDSGVFPNNHSSDTFVGANLVLGAGVPTHSGNRFFGELRAGLGDIPSLKIMAGWNFKM